jgi:hypothetical protein
VTVFDEICDFADTKLKGSPFTFVVVGWIRGEENNPSSVLMSGPPLFHGAAIDAMRMAALKEERARAGLLGKKP